MAIGLFFGVLFAAVEKVALVFLARDVLGTGPAGFGVITSAFGVGMIVSSLTLIRLNPRSVAATLFTAGRLLTGLGVLGTGLAPFVWVAALTQALAGVGNGVENIAADTITYPVGGLLLDVTSPRVVLLMAGTGVLFTVLILTLMLSRRTGD